jgi:hypothetical protein
MAGRAGHGLLELQAPRGPQRGITEGDLDLDPQVLAPRRAGSSFEERVAEEVAENAAEARKDIFRALEAFEADIIETGLAPAVVELALLGVGQHFIGGADLLEAFFGLAIARIAVRMILHRQLAIGSFDLFGRGVSLHPENLVVVFG